MIQLAWLWLRYQPGSARAERFRERVGALAGRTRRIDSPPCFRWGASRRGFLVPEAFRCESTRGPDRMSYYSSARLTRSCTSPLSYPSPP
jgi:hypothetical protein